MKLLESHTSAGRGCSGWSSAGQLFHGEVRAGYIASFFASDTLDDHGKNLEDGAASSGAEVRQTEGNSGAGRG